MKSVCVVFVCLVLLFSFSFTCSAGIVIDDSIFDALAPETRELLEQFGIDEDIGENFSQISPEKALDTVYGMFRNSFSDIASSAGVCLALIFITSLITGIIPENGNLALMGRSISLLILMFSVVSRTGDIFSQCASALLVTKDFMLVLIPVFAGVVAAGGNAGVAMSFNTVAFSFAQFSVIIFNGIIPVVTSVMIAVCASGTLSPIIKFDGIGKTVARIVNLFMAFIAGVFVAVLSIRGVIAGAADSVTIRGVRFLIGNVVPVVGSAIGEALNSIVASVGLIKNTVGMVGIAAILIINLPPVVNVVMWKTALYFLGISSDVSGNAEIRSFCDNMGNVLSVITGAVCFTVFVFVISIAIIITVSRS